MYLCIAPLSRFYYPEARRFVNAFYYYYYFVDLKCDRQKLVSICLHYMCTYFVFTNKNWYFLHVQLSFAGLS